jgi:hypothetical protein
MRPEHTEYQNRDALRYIDSDVLNHKTVIVG